jgi:hypothetical protein
LLPHQAKRLEQIATQSRLQKQSLARVLTSDPFKSELGITDFQSREIRQAEQEIEAELAAEYGELRKRAQEKLLSRLKPSQRDKVKELVGTSFEFQAKKEDKKAIKKKKKQKK